MALINDASKLAQKLQNLPEHERVPGLVTSPGNIAFRFLDAISPHIHTETPRFCEWGSGVGVVTCLASLKGWNAIGIEIETRLVLEARRLASAHRIQASFYEGSYKPDALFTSETTLETFETEYGFGLFDFDIIYIYAWPAEKNRVTEAVARYAKPGTIFMHYGGGLTCEAFRVV
jgi:hypothetical protein